ncbi:MAG: YceI family protein [Myxococcales bacterium]|nr:YceI family protein [Myxococcales bacterium]
MTARSSVHNTEIVWKGIAGTIDASAGEDASNMKADLAVDMTTADAGDWLKNRKMRKDMQFDKHPAASFSLDSVDDLVQDGERMRATIHGTLKWRGKSISVTAKGEGTLGASELLAKGSFDIDMTALGITPPKVLMIKVEDVVNCQLELHATV